MKIGILTYHRTHNYGGCLQALATKLFLESKGHEVYYVDYWPDYHKRAYSVFDKDIFNRNKFRGKIRYLLEVIRTYPFVRKRQKVFKNYIEKYVEPYCKPLSEQYDVIMYGSDQIWRKQTALRDYNPVYFGVNNFRAKKHIAYAASMGLLPETKEDGYRIASMLKNFNAISVRESQLKDYLEEIGIEHVCQTIDPTMLLDAEAWDRVLPSEPYLGDRYILVYVLWGDVFDMSSVYALAKKENLMVKTLRGFAKKERYRS